MKSRPLIDKTFCFQERFKLIQSILCVPGFALLASALNGCHSTSSQAAGLHSADHAVALNDARTIELTLRKIFDRPGAPLTVKPISIEGDFAVAGWMQHGTGGRTLLKRQQRQWKIALCGDAGLLDANNLEKMGLSHSGALKLAQKIKTAEAGLTEQERIQISKFHGVMHVGEVHPQPQ
jgi:hypothetical protein